MRVSKNYMHVTSSRSCVVNTARVPVAYSAYQLPKELTAWRLAHRITYPEYSRGLLLHTLFGFQCAQYFNALSTFLNKTRLNCLTHPPLWMKFSFCCSRLVTCCLVGSLMKRQRKHTRPQLWTQLRYVPYGHWWMVMVQAFISVCINLQTEPCH